MASFQITKVRTEATYGSTHEHISAVELDGNPNWRYSRDTIIWNLKQIDGDRYYTLGGSQRAEVYVRGCPFCTFGAYITTRADSTTADNLLSLPRF